MSIVSSMRTSFPSSVTNCRLFGFPLVKGPSPTIRPSPRTRSTTSAQLRPVPAAYRKPRKGEFRQPSAASSARAGGLNVLSAERQVLVRPSARGHGAANTRGRNDSGCRSTGTCRIIPAASLAMCVGMAAVALALRTRNGRPVAPAGHKRARTPSGELGQKGTYSLRGEPHPASFTTGRLCCRKGRLPVAVCRRFL
jgi:hypothetical protein